jgi:hypothetical protein
MPHMIVAVHAQRGTPRPKWLVFQPSRYRIGVHLQTSGKDVALGLQSGPQPVKAHSQSARSASNTGAAICPCLRRGNCKLGRCRCLHRHQFLRPRTLQITRRSARWQTACNARANQGHGGHQPKNTHQIPLLSGTSQNLDRLRPRSNCAPLPPSTRRTNFKRPGPLCRNFEPQNRDLHGFSLCSKDIA